jgi:hypothetical protein
MGIIEVSAPKNRLTLTQRWSHIFTLGLALALFLFGLNMRSSILNASVPYLNNEVGIEAELPANWLLDTDGDYVFRARDVAKRGYKTTIQMSVRPISDDTAARNVSDRLALDRGQTLIDYNIQSTDPYTFTEPDDSLAVNYSYVSRNTSPFLRSVPFVVLGLDIITLQRGQAIITTFRAEADIFDQEFVRFERFLRTLEF